MREAVAELGLRHAVITAVTRDDLADLSVDELSEMTAMESERAKGLIMKARAHWFEDAPAEAEHAAVAAAPAQH